MHSLLCQFFALGASSTRVMIIVALQLCGLLAAHPAAGPFYCLPGPGGSPSLLQQLVLFGGAAEVVPGGSAGVSGQFGSFGIAGGDEGCWDVERQRGGMLLDYQTANLLY